MSFKVLEILSWNTIRVETNWTWDNNKGNEVVINGYDIANSGIPQDLAQNICVDRLKNLLIDKEVTLMTPATIVSANKRISCNVMLNGNNVAYYFTEFRK